MRDLIVQIKDATKLQQLYLLKELMIENHILLRDLILHHRVVRSALRLLQEVEHHARAVNKTIRQMDTKRKSAEKEWLAHWGIYESERQDWPQVGDWI